MMIKTCLKFFYRDNFRMIVNISVYFTSYEVCSVLLLIASQNIQRLFQEILIVTVENHFSLAAKKRIRSN